MRVNAFFTFAIVGQYGSGPVSSVPQAAVLQTLVLSTQQLVNPKKQAVRQACHQTRVCVCVFTHGVCVDTLCGHAQEEGQDSICSRKVFPTPSHPLCVFVCSGCS